MTSLGRKDPISKILKNLRLFVKNHSCHNFAISLLYSKQPPLHPRCPLGRLRSTEVGFCFFWISAISAHSHPTPDHPVHFTYARPPTRLRKPASAPFFPFSEANSSVLGFSALQKTGPVGGGSYAAVERAVKDVLASDPPR